MTRIKGGITRFWQWLAPRVALDCRALAVFRIALGLVILGDVFARAQDLTAHYTDSGVLPIHLLPIDSLSGAAFAPHLYITSPLGSGLLFVLLGLAAAGLTLGLASRWMVLICWLLLHSIQLRNPYINHAGDKVLMVMLFWAFFLPLSHYYSLRFKRTGSNRLPPSSSIVTSAASLGILLQLGSIYLMGAIRKSGTMWHDGSAVWYVLQIDQYARPWTRALLDFPTLLQLLTWGTLAIEFIAPLLLFTGLTRWRALGVGLIILLQLGFLATLQLGSFPWISLAVCLFAWPVLRNKGVIKPETNPPVFNRAAAYLVGLLATWNVLTLFQYPSEMKERLPNWFSRGLEIIRFDQYWSMFAPNPMTIDGWYQISAETTDGDKVNLLNPHQTLSQDKPTNVSKSFPSDRWKEYLMTLTDLGDPAPFWGAVGRYLARQYEQQHKSTIVPSSIRVVYLMERTTPTTELEPTPEPAWP